ncbi:MAG: sulfite exporter TauE/SafE family protein [Clostridia bacterium]|nr:sulfite exporter TauE/SafE family protein [Clostridia bacterium]
MNKEKLKTTSIDIGLGAVTGMVNGLFGAGGGMIAVPLLKKRGLNQKDAQKNAVAVILPLAVISAVIYLIKGYVSFKDAYIYMPTGVLGAFIGTKILSILSPKLLKGIFGGFMLYAGIRLLLR